MNKHRKYLGASILLLCLFFAGCNFSGKDQTETDNNLTEAYKAYAEYLETNTLYPDFAAGQYEKGENRLVYALAYIDDDDIPELIYGGTEDVSYANSYILTYIDGTVYRMGPVGPYHQFEFQEKKNVIVENDIREGYAVYTYLEITKEGTLDTLCEAWYSENPDGDTGDIYYIAGEQATEEEFETYLSELDLSEKTIWDCDESSNEIINAESIEQLKDGKFILSQNIEGALVQLGLCYDDFDAEVVNGDSWGEQFISDFLLNSRYSFDYLDEIIDANDGLITKEQAEYMQYSLTGIQKDLPIAEGETLDTANASSGYSFGRIADYDYEINADEIKVTADFEVGFDGSEEYTKQYRLSAVLVSDPESCFDGYCVKSLTTEDVTLENN